MSYKEETRRAYDSFPEAFDSKFEEYLQTYLRREIEEFFRKLPIKGKILDVGSGTGNQASYLRQQGFDVTCIDISEEMVKACKAKGLRALLMDFEDLQFPQESFDGALAYTSLIHIPKSNLENALKQIAKVMSPTGTFFLGMKQGHGEGFREQEKYPSVKRWFSLYTDEELRRSLLPIFNIELYTKTEVDPNHVFLNYILRKKG